MIAPQLALADMPFVAIDTETTGLDVHDGVESEDRVVEIAIASASLRKGTQPKIALHAVVNPGIPIPEPATNIHGISNADVAGMPPLAAHRDRIFDLCEGGLVVAHNAPFDYLALAASGVDLGWHSTPWIDTKVLARAVWRFDTSTLDAVTQRLGYALRGAHGARCDAAGAALVLRPLLRALWQQGVKLRTVGELLAWQRETALEQELSLAEWFRKAGRVEPPLLPWHVLEDVALPEWDVRPTSPTWEILANGAIRPIPPGEDR